MSASTLYLNHLANLFPVVDTATRTARTTDELWQDFNARWANLSTRSTANELLGLSAITYALSAHLTRKMPAQIMADAMALHDAKNRGYTGGSEDPWSNFRLAQKFGVSTKQGVLVRLSDKYSRIAALRVNPANDAVGESLIDSINDFAAYCIIAVCVTEEFA